jgi:hypothetical protein
LRSWAPRSIKNVLITAPEYEGAGGSQVEISSRTNLFLETEIASLTALCGVVRDQSVDDVLQEVRRRLTQWGYPMKGKPSDNRPSGAGIGVHVVHDSGEDDTED